MGGRELKQLEGVGGRLFGEVGKGWGSTHIHTEPSRQTKN